MTNFLLWFFAIPVAIVILSVIFETIINSPIKIAGITFSIFLIVTFAVGDETLLIFTILYTLLAFIVSWITRQWICSNNNNATIVENARDTAIEELLKQSSINDNNYTNTNADYTGRYRRR